MLPINNNVKYKKILSLVFCSARELPT